MSKSAPEVVRQKVAGGFVLPLAWQLFAAWWCYRNGSMPLRAFRVWLALWEMVARRCTLAASRRPKFDLRELARLVGGVGGEHLRSDLRRLRRLGLVTFDGGRIQFIEAPEKLVVPDLDAFFVTLESVPNHKRRVPIPRRALRYLTGCGKRVLLATAMGEAMRCLYYRNHEVSSRGRCKASWVGKVFEVDLRGVKRARSHLEAIGLLVPVGESCSRERVFERRWGKAMSWNLEWAGVQSPEAPELSERAPVVASELPPVEAKNDTRLPPVESNNTLLTEQNKNQKPGLPGPAPCSCRKNTGSEKAPTMRDIVEVDLTDDARSAALLRDAVNRGLIEDSEASELRFFGLIEHARRYGTTNRPGLLRSLVENKRYYVTQDDEDEARRRLRRMKHLADPPASVRASGVEVPERPPQAVGDMLGALLASMRQARAAHA